MNGVRSKAISLPLALAVLGMQVSSALAFNHGPKLSFREFLQDQGLGGNEAPSQAPLFLFVQIRGMTQMLASHARTPFLDQLSQNGAQGTVKVTGTPRSLASMATVLTGRSPESHRVTGEQWRSWKGTIQSPTILDFAQQAGLETTVVGSHLNLRLLKNPANVDTFHLLKANPWAPKGPAQPILKTAKQQIASGTRGLMLLSFNDVSDHDRRYGMDAIETVQSLENIDRALEQLDQWLEQNNLKGRTTWVVCGTSDQSNEPLALTLSGNGVEPNLKLGSVDLKDVAPTLQLLWGQPLASKLEGDPLSQVVARSGSQWANGHPMPTSESAYPLD